MAGIVRDSLFIVAAGEVGVTAIAMGQCMVGLQLDRLVEIGKRLLGAALHRVDRAAINQRIDVRRIDVPLLLSALSSPLLS